MLDPWSLDFYCRCFLPMLRREMRPRVAWPCMSWSGMTNQHGYGVMLLPDFMIGAPHYSLRMIGVDPSGYTIRHVCDNRLCCNPLHMLLGDTRDNNLDRYEHGSIRASLALAWAPFAPNYRPNRFQRPSNPWTRPLELALAS